MRKILVLGGAGKSTSYLLDYFLEKSTAEQLEITIGDLKPDLIPDQIKNHSSCKVVELDIFNDAMRKEQVQKSTIVVSMLPAHLHLVVAKDCLQFNKHLITASYVSPELKNYRKK